jgi:hypothetical protein
VAPQNALSAVGFSSSLETASHSVRDIDFVSSAAAPVDFTGLPNDTRQIISSDENTQGVTTGGCANKLNSV